MYDFFFYLYFSDIFSYLFCIFVTSYINSLVIMKRLLVFFAAIFVCGILSAQSVFTVVYATSDDGFVNVRSQPSNKGRILTKLYMFSHGLGSGVLRGTSGNWTKVSVGKVTGWAYSKYVGSQNWYKGDGSPRLIAAKNPTPIFAENYADKGDYPLFTTISRGTIIADTFEEDEQYYILTTAHDNLFIRKSDANVIP